MKSIKNLLVPFIILIALVISAVVYFAVEKIRSKEPADTSVGMVDIVYYNASDIASLSVYDRENGIDSLVNCSLDSNNTIHYEYCGADAEPSVTYSQSKLAAYVSALSCYSSNYKVSSTGNYSEYGLDTPSYVITVKTVNGNDTTVNLGNRTPDGKNCYMYVSGSSDIYLVNVDKLYQAEKNAMSFMDSSVLSLDYNEIKSVHFDRKSDGLSLDVSITVKDSGNVAYDIIKPYSHKASTYFEKMIDSVTHLEIAEFIDISISELSKYGLDIPEYHFVITMNSGEKTELYFSKQINGYYYGYISGSDNYFMLTGYQLEGLDLNETVLIDPYICYCYIKDISSITGTYGDRSFKFSLDVPLGKNIMSEGVIVQR